MTAQELKERVMQHGKLNVMHKNGTIHTSPILALAEDIRLFNELKQKAQFTEQHQELAKVIAKCCSNTEKQIDRAEHFLMDYDEVLSGQQYDPVDHWAARLMTEESHTVARWLEEKAQDIRDLKQEKLMDDKLVRKACHSPEGVETLPDSGMFILRYDPSQSLVGTRPANDYSIEVQESDTIASILRKTTPYMQEMLDDYFGVDESDKNQRLFISHQATIDGEHAYCTIVYTGYESENEGEVAALVENQFSHAIDSQIRLEWNSEVYGVSAAQIENEKSLEESRKAADTMIHTAPTITRPQPIAQNVNLNGYVQEKTLENDGYDIV